MSTTSLRRSTLSNPIKYNSVLSGNNIQSFGSYIVRGQGGNPDSAGSASIELMAFPTEVVSVISTALSAAKYFMTGMANSGVAGYVGGGRLQSNNAVQTTVEKLAFPGQTISVLGTGLSAARYEMISFENIAVAGYFYGGRNSSGNATGITDKFAFATDTRTTPSLAFGNALVGASAINQSVFGYYAGGFTTSRVNTVFKLLFSNDSVTNLSTKLSTGKGNMAGIQNRGVAAYFCGGISSQTLNEYEKVLFSNDTRTTIVNSIGGTVGDPAGSSNGNVAGYIIGGSEGSTTTARASIVKISFPTETRSYVPTGLVVRVLSAGVSTNTGTA